MRGKVLGKTKRRVALWLMLLLACGLSACGRSKKERSETPDGVGPKETRELECFVGSASKPATEELAALFEKERGVRVLLHFGGSGKMLSQLELGQRGDLYFPGSSDYMELAKRRKLVLPETEQRIVYLVPAINVPRGNPKGIRELNDLAKPGLRVGMARPDSVCVGLYGEEVLRAAGLWEAVEPQLVTQTESCAKTAQIVALGHVDAVMGWRVFEYWKPDAIETVLLKPREIARIGYIPAAVAQVSRQRALAEEFIAFMRSPRGQALFRKWHYLTDLTEARRFALPTTPVGGEWKRKGE